MTMVRTQLLTPDSRGIQSAASILKARGLVAFPTETVYGLGADACNGAAVAKVFEAKGRPSFNPLIIHVADLETARLYGVFDDQALLLAKAFWPGPLSLVVPVRSGCGLSEIVTAGLDTVAIRVPDHSIASELLKIFGGAVAAPSANPSGRISPTTAEHVLDGLDGKIDAVVKGGACPVGVESTIVLTGGGTAELLRPGGLPEEILGKALGAQLAPLKNAKSPLSPGQLTSHYAPSVQVLINTPERLANGLWMGFGSKDTDADISLSVSGDLIEAAANLFSHLRKLDDLARKTGQSRISVSPVPNIGVGVAINDRLKRASADR